MKPKLRNYHLFTQDNGIGSDTFYSLVFSRDGALFVEARTDFNQPHKTDTVTQIEPMEFPSVALGDRTLQEIVVDWLDTNLPPNPKPKWGEGVVVIEP